MRRLLRLLGLLILCACSATPEEKIKPAQNLGELQLQLGKILKDSNVPGMSIAIVHRDRVDYVAGIGLADVATKTRATAQTLFRIGSVSKAFVSLSILKLASEGKLTLADQVRSLVPKIQMWVAFRDALSSPVLVVDLLEHTTGWDDMHLREYANEEAKHTLLGGLTYDGSSRFMRWEAGTRMAYCNSGPAVAAYIVEKVTGEFFEDYVQKNFFDTIGMHNATYFEPKANLTKLYHEDGTTPFPYWHLIYRPSGSINASANDMAPYLQFYLNRGRVGETQVMPAASIDRMETPTRTWAAQQGLKTGFGLGNYTSIHDGFLYHGHDGGVEGGLTKMEYLPDAGVGYFYSINSGNGEAFKKIGETIRAFITRDLAKPAPTPAAPLPEDANDYAGWYEYDSPRVQALHFLDRILGMSHVEFENGKMILSTLNERGIEYVSVGNRQFRALPKDEAPEPVATALLINSKEERRYVEEGRYIQVGNGTQTLKQIPTWLAWLQIFLTLWFVLAFNLTILYAPFWLIGGIFKKRRRPTERAIRIAPLVAALSIILFVVAFNLASEDLISQMGRLTFLSGLAYGSTLLFGLACIASALSLWVSYFHPVRRLVRWHALFVTIGLSIGALYLEYWGVIGYRPWA